MKINLQKNLQMINFFALKNGGKINYTKVLKLIYFSDKYMLCKHGRMISNDHYAALKNGPVPSITKEIAEGVVKDTTGDADFPISKKYCNQYLGNKGGWQIESLKRFDDDLFSDAEIEAMESVYQKLGEKGVWQLRDLTHDFYEWKKHNVNGITKRYAPMNILDFFSINNGIELDNFFESEDLETNKKFFIAMNGQCDCANPF